MEVQISNQQSCWKYRLFYIGTYRSIDFFRNRKTSVSKTRVVMCNIGLQEILKTTFLKFFASNDFYSNSFLFWSSFRKFEISLVFVWEFFFNSLHEVCYEKLSNKTNMYLNISLLEFFETEMFLISILQISSMWLYNIFFVG